MDIELDWVFDKENKKIGVKVVSNPSNFEFDGISLWSEIPVNHKDIPGEAGETTRICRGIYKLVPPPEKETGNFIEIDYNENFEL